MKYHVGKFYKATNNEFDGTIIRVDAVNEYGKVRYTIVNACIHSGALCGAFYANSCNGKKFHECCVTFK